MKKFLVKWWALVLIAVAILTFSLGINLYPATYISAQGGMLAAVINAAYLSTATIILLTPGLFLEKWAKEIEAKDPCPQCHGTGFERNFIRVELRHGANHHSFAPEMIAEHHLGYFLCNRCTAPSPAAILDSIERTKKIKEFLDK